MKRFLLILSLLLVILLPFIYARTDNVGDIFDEIKETAISIKESSIVQDTLNFLYEGVQSIVFWVEDILENNPKAPTQENNIEKPLLEQPKEQAFSIHNIEIGDPLDKVENQLGEPKRITTNEYGSNWYTYHKNYHNFLNVTFNEHNQVAGLYTNQDILSSKNGIKIGTPKEKVDEILGEPLTKIKRGLYFYRFNENEDYQVFHIDNNYVTIFYDKHENNTVTSIQIISEELEKKKTGLYAKASPQLIEGLERQLFDLTNATRVNYNLQPLIWDEQVRKIAREHSLDMAENKYFDHTNLDGQSPYDRMQEDNLFFTVAGENLAYGQFSSIFAHEGLMNSKGHRNNILQTEYEYLGVGVAFNSQSQPFFTENFYKK